MNTLSLIIAKINALLTPLERILSKYLSIIKKILLGVSFLALFLIFIPSLREDIGEQAYNLLFFILFLPIVVRVIGLSLAKKLMPLRKELGILMGVLAWVHGAGYLVRYPDILTASYFWWQEGFVSYFAMGFVALILTTPLLLTSNNYSMKLLGKRWKLLHRSVYFVAIFVVLHVILIDWASSNSIDYGALVLFGFFLFGKILERRGITLLSKKESDTSRLQ